MTKCDFCTKSLPNGKCWWETIAREADCEKAIKCMTEALKIVMRKKINSTIIF